MSRLVPFKHSELFREEPYINTRPSYIFRCSFLLLCDSPFFFFYSSKVFKGFMNGKYSEHCSLAEIKILVSPTYKSRLPGFSLKGGMGLERDKWEQVGTLVLRRARETRMPQQETSGPQLQRRSLHLGWFGWFLLAGSLLHHCYLLVHVALPTPSPEGDTHLQGEAAPS